MNGKSARNLRNLVKEVAGEVPAENQYREEETYKLVQAGINPDGTPRMINQRCVTKVLVNCQRYLYQRAKARHYQYTQN